MTLVLFITEGLLGLLFNHYDLLRVLISTTLICTSTVIESIHAICDLKQVESNLVLFWPQTSH